MKNARTKSSPVFIFEQAKHHTGEVYICFSAFFVIYPTVYGKWYEVNSGHSSTVKKKSQSHLIQFLGQHQEIQIDHYGNSHNVILQTICSKYTNHSNIL